MTQKILIAADHAGFVLKQHLLGFLQKNGFEVVDLGTYSTDSVDYSDYGHAAAKSILEGVADRGIVICGTGIGISIAANRFKGIHCAVINDVETAKLGRSHNNINLLALGGRVLDPTQAETIVDAFLTTPFEGGRHQNRIVKIDNPV
jgi:ribose 5-phosphate isomerase B